MPNKHYGIVYMGSKSRIAKHICSILPAGNRLVDLFGGGMAITDCAISEYKYKWQFFIYNDYDPILVDLIKRSIEDKLPQKPEWIDRETFKKYINIDGYIRYCWSFGCYGRTYLYGKENEELKKSFYNWVVFNIKDEFINKNYTNIELKESDIYKRLQEFNKIKNKLDMDVKLEAITRLKLMKDLKHLINFYKKQKLYITNNSYLDYVYEDGDVVYCDIPYENTAGYKIGDFNQEEFVNWALSRPYPVFISSLFKWSYKDKFHLIWGRDINSTFCKDSNDVEQSEVLYCNKPYKQWGYYKQLNLFED